MAVALGPILKFCGVDDDLWSVSALVVCGGGEPAPAVLVYDGDKWDAIGAVSLGERRQQKSGYTVWRYRFAIAQKAAQQEIRYTVGSVEYIFMVPPAGGAPTCAYTSCNGFSDAKLMKQVQDKNALWTTMRLRHGERPYHLLLMGGDQIYSDSMWQELRGLKTWAGLSGRERNAAPFPDELRAQVDGFFLENYLERWSQPEVAAMMASVPTVMMWDDHDIFDGWGSYPAEQQASPVYQGIYAIARAYFQLFQLHANAATPPLPLLPNQPGFSYGLRVGGYAILALDLRSERSKTTVMGAAAWHAAYAWLDKQKNCDHLLVMSSIPVVHPDFSTLETLLCALPGRQELEDDLQDHWLSRSHRQERLRLIHRLLDWSAGTGGRVTVLSGDVHVGAVGVIQAQRRDVPANANVINQLTSSGIVHPAPPAMALFYLEHVGARVETVDRGITATMFEFPGTSHRYIGARNFLSLEPDLPQQSAEKRIWANWWVEGEDLPYTKTIHVVK
ncbi:hypothetical protein ACFDR9_000529 [Janthinobacterium sp. CG_23.3]|uniref:alkaline phosphatase D family protein n=1 Tax=unclassified Janthinobacterium TaxID=2610881 RepID=UPI00034BC684|nr:alkaline phosphatase D family protein [Janthinobacterium sp. CG3]